MFVSLIEDKGRTDDDSQSYVNDNYDDDNVFFFLIVVEFIGIKIIRSNKITSYTNIRYNEEDGKDNKSNI